MLASEVLPQILARKGGDDPIRVWSAGCATGEEAYTLTMVLAETLGLEEFRRRVKIYATDADEHALTAARQASYSARDVEAIPAELLDRYFERIDERFVFRKDLRRFVIFGRNDLVQDAPISRIDLLACRNTLMYFNAATQAKILARFHFALENHGVLFLGRAETLLTHSSTFVPVDLKRRLFGKVPRITMRNRMFVPLGADDGAPIIPFAAERALRDSAFDVSTVAQIVLDSAGQLALANERASSLFGLGPRDIGRPIQDLELSYRPADLRSTIDQAWAERRAVTLKAVEWLQHGDMRWLDIQVMPLHEQGSSASGTSITFTDVTTAQRLQRELEQTNAELEDAYEELQSTNEELETTNEELQSTVEELETTNEELQCTNEELETMNEELESTNEELTTINDELRRRSDELNDTNSFMGSVLTSLRGGVAVLDADLRIEVWNERASELWGLRADEVRGQSFLALDIGLPVHDIARALRTCLAGDSREEKLSVTAVSRRGRTIGCRVTCTPLRSALDALPRGVIIVTEEIPAAVAVDSA